MPVRDVNRPGANSAVSAAIDLLSARRRLLHQHYCTTLPPAMDETRDTKDGSVVNEDGSDDASDGRGGEGR